MTATSETAECVHIVDDEADVRESIRLLLTASGYWCRCHDSGPAFLEACDGATRGCVLLDVRMPGMTGLEAQQAMTERGIRLPVVFISGHGDIPMAVRAVQAGAQDFLEKPFNDAILLGCVDEALAADRAQRSRQAEWQGVAARLESLTPREREVLDRLVEGKVNKIIARELDASTRTIEIHRARVLHKMAVDNATQLVREVAPLLEG